MRYPRLTRYAVLKAGTAALIASASLQNSTRAGPLYWDADGVTPVNGGSGNWSDFVPSNWAVDSSGSAYTAWHNANGDIAIFGGTAGTISIQNGTSVTAGGLEFDVSGYNIDALTSGSINLVGAATINVVAGTAIVPFITGSAGLTKIGAGTLITGGNNYTGGTNINGGALQVFQNNGLPAGSALSINNTGSGAALELGTFTISVSSLNMSGITTIDGTGTINITGSGSVSMSGTSLDGGGDFIGGAAGSALVFTNSPTFDVTGAGAVNAAIIAPSNAVLTKQGAGSLVIGAIGTNSFGSVIIKGGVLDIPFDAALGTAPASPVSNNITLDGGTLRFYSNLAAGMSLNSNRGMVVNPSGGTIDFSQSSGTPTIAFNISGAGHLTKAGPRTVSISSSNCFSGGLTVALGRVNLQNPNAAGTGDITLAATGTGTANLGIGGIIGLPVTIANNIILAPVNNGTNSFDVNTNCTLTINGTISGTGGFVRGLTNSTNGALVLTNHSNSYSGLTTIQQGILRLGANEVIPDTSVVQFKPGGGSPQYGTFDVNGMTETIAGLSGDGPVNLGSGNLIIAEDSKANSAGVISGTGSVTKTASGTEIFVGSNTYTGLTTVSGGMLTLNTPAWPPVLTTGAGANITTGRLVFSYILNSSPAATIAALLKTSHDDNGFNNTQRLRSTTAGASKGLGWTDDGFQTVVGYVYYGDNDLSGTVDLTDFTYLAANFNNVGGATWLQGDYNYDGNVDLTDFTFLASNFNKSLALSAPPAAGVGSTVPEPTALISVSAGCALLRRRRRRF
jgi:autotransporter-associated beta strand protein